MEAAALQDLLDHFPVGLSVVDREGVHRYANLRVAELFDFPPDLLRPGTHSRELLRLQVERGDFGPGDPETLIQQIMAIVLMRTPGSERTQRTLSNGRTLEMYRRRLVDGSVACVYLDVSDRRHTEEALARERTLLRTTLDLMPCGILVSDRDLRFEVVNRQVAELFGVPPSLIRDGGSYHETIRYQAERGDFGPGEVPLYIEREIAKLREQTGEHIWQRTLASGRTIEIRRRISEGGRHISIYTDVSDSNRVARELQAAKVELEKTLAKLAETNTVLQRQAHTDALTGAWNRHYFMVRAREEVARCRREPRHALGVVLLDVDRFKSINDRFGHAEGDRVLVDLVRALGAVLRTQDLFSRVGGEEFAVLLPDTDLSGALRLAERLRLGAHRVSLPDGTGVTVSLGVTVLRASDRTIDPALSRADQALYRAKHAGRDRVMSADELD